MPRAFLVLLLSSILAVQLLPAARADFPGDVYCWGLNSAQQLGAAELSPLTGTTATTGSEDGSGSGAPGGASGSSSRWARNATRPWELTLLNTNFIFESISADNTYVCGVTTRGTIACWGDDTPINYDTLQDLPPTEVDFEGGSFVQVVTGFSFACGLLEDGSAACFGRNDRGQLGSGSPEPLESTTPLLVAGGQHTFSSLAAGTSHACGVLNASRRAVCWGSNTANQLGVDSSTQAFSPYPVVVDASLEFSQVATGDSFSCGLLLNASVVCWGGYGDAGLTQLLPPAPRLVVEGYAVELLAAKRATACGITAGGEVACSGVVDSFIDAAGYPDQTFSSTPVLIDDTRNFTSLSVGGSGFYFHACGLEDGAALCWGLNNEGQLGAEGPFTSATPVPVQTDLLFSDISAGGAFTCAVQA